MPILVKPIKPGRFKVPAFMDEIKREAESISKDILLDFELTTATWKHQVDFERDVEVGPDPLGGVAIMVSTDDEIYGYVSRGTEPHVILPKGNYPLRFQSGYKAKTVPGKLTARSGGPFGPKVAAYAVNHPGTKARKFEEQVEDIWEKKFQRRMQSALNRASKKSGQSI